MPQPAYIFDLDGTLVDSRQDLATAVNLMRRDLGLPPLPLDTVVGFVGHGIRRLVERALQDAGTPGPSVDDGIGLMRDHYAEHLLDQTALYPGTLAALTALAGTGAHLAIVTNKPGEPARRICDRLGLSALVPRILGGDACPRIKPDPMPLLEVLRQSGADPTRSWMIGDHVTDLEAGRRAGLRRCLCRFGFGDPGSEVPDLAVDSLTEFAAHVLRPR
ncbi:MAG: HAD-IIIA family hydrolase [Lentisphaerae bacterium]|nr:HAD-IIIA family hydrolase [Lentisphaerota bacterium]